jgi:DUF4097 and DUF4098 domain-containing protein YvlB
VAATEETFHKSFPVEPGGKLVVNVEFGEVTVSTHATSEVVVDVWRQVIRKNKADEESFLAGAPVKFAQEGETVTVESRRKERTGWPQGWSGFRNRTEGRYMIQVPAQFNVQLNTAGGGISVTDLAGEVNSDTSGGGLRFTRVRGPLRGDTSGGGIQVSDCEGKIEINTSGGGITVTGGAGSLVAGTSGGAITVRSFAGPARVETSGGGITLDHVGGKLDGSTSGGPINVTLPSPLPGEVRLTTSGGGVTVRVPEEASFQLDAETSGGGVTCDLPITIDGKKQHGRLKGAVNGGETPVRLRSSGGGIQIQKT